jgi:hypothetical protein
MKPLSFISIVGAIACTVSAQNSPFYWPEDQKVISPFAKTGKMEQIGRTGVAAMHAVLLK